MGASAKKIITFQSKINRKMLNVFVKNTAICPIYNIKSDFEEHSSTRDQEKPNQEPQKTPSRLKRIDALCALSAVTA